MSAHSTLDRESFQNLLASAFAVQESLLDTQWLSGVGELLHLIAAGKLDVNGATQLIADRARNVANAAGVAIGLLKGDQLVYRAGSGSAAKYIGRHVIATLSVPTNTQARREILRVEDAQTDSGIGAAICRQFEARSLLILPIYHDRTLAGVLEVFFSEAHAFQDREVCTYQLMARVVGEAMAHAIPPEQKKMPTTERLTTIPQAIEQITPQMQRFSVSRSPANKQAIGHASGAATAKVEKLPSRRGLSARADTVITHRAKRVPSHMRLWRVADRAAVAIVLVTASWIAYTYRGPTSPLDASARQRSSAIEQPLPLATQRPVPAERDTSKPQSVFVPMDEETIAAGSTPRRVRIGDNEIDYISEDVTVRHFIPRPAPQQVSGADYRVDYVSEDVTVRHFTPKLAVVSPSRPVDRGAASAHSKQ